MAANSRRDHRHVGIIAKKRYQSWQVYRPGGAQAQKTRKYRFLTGLRAVGFTAPRRRGYQRYVGIITQQAA